MTLIYQDLMRHSTTGSEVHVEHVPHLICTRCGQTVLTPETERRIAAAVRFAVRQGTAVLA